MLYNGGKLLWVCLMTQLYFWVPVLLLTFSVLAYLIAPVFAFIGGDIKQLQTKLRLKTALGITVLGLSVVLAYLFMGSLSFIIPEPKPVIDEQTAAVIAQIEQHLEENPEDAGGWEVVAPTYLFTNQPAKAFDAFANAIKLGKSSGENWLGLGKADLMVNKGNFSSMSEVAFTKATEKSPNNLEAMFFYASMLHSMQESEQAVNALNDFIKNTNYSADELLPLTEVLNVIIKDREE